VAKIKVLEDVSITVGGGKDQVFRAGQHDVKDANREALEKLVGLGLAELVKPAKEE
jgi:hypothetical protein